LAANHSGNLPGGQKDHHLLLAALGVFGTGAG
jgi:hypothetical protein